MLVSLSIRNFILIEDAVLEFHPGLTVLTGETGAGKTLLTRALGLLMGERAEEGLVGPTADEASIEAVFTAERSALTEVADQVRDLLSADEDETVEELIVTRRLSREGRNRCYINGSTVTLTVLGDVLGRLLSFAGQHEYRRLLDSAYQLTVLDEWAGAETAALRERYRLAYLQARETDRALAEAERSREDQEREMRLLRYEVDELTSAALSVAEEEALTAEQRRLARAEELLAGVGLAADLLTGEDEQPDAGGLIAQASAQLGHLAGVDEDVDALAATLVDIQYRLTELARELRSLLGRITVDPERLQNVESRLRLYTDLARKHGGSTLQALEYFGRSTERLQHLEQAQEDLAGLAEARSAHRALALELAERLSQQRREAAPRLEEAAGWQLADLGMAEAVFRVVLHERAEGQPPWEDLRESGAETVEFRLSANPGLPERSLAATASGGELSRVLLGLKCALAGSGGDETLVFDEIDAGIGGRTAVAVATKLSELAQASQSVVVTHLASVAALADRHYSIDKVSARGSGTSTRLVLLDEAQVVEELCRMMGGRPQDQEAMAHARRLRDSAHTSC